MATSDFQRYLDEALPKCVLAPEEDDCVKQETARPQRLIGATPEHIRAVLEKVPYYPDEIWKFTAMTERFPAVDAVEVVHGRWEKREAVVFDDELVGYRCSECNTTWDAETNYCPNCGAKMDGGNQDG